MVWPFKQDASEKTPQTSFTCQNQWDQLDNLEPDGPININDLEWNRLGLYPNQTMELMEDREVWNLNLKFLPCNPYGKAGKEERV